MWKRAGFASSRLRRGDTIAPPSGLKILIAGAAGFIGRHLVGSLGAENEVFAICRREPPQEWDGNVKVIRADLRLPLPAAFPEKVDAVVNLAMNPSKDTTQWEEGIEVNLLAQERLLRYAVAAKTSAFLYTSSGNVYGRGPLPFKEDDLPAEPPNVYGEMKRIAELLALGRAGEMGISVLRLFAPYGPGQGPQLIPRLVDRVRAGQEVTITNDGNPRLNPIFIDDLIRVFDLCLERPETRVMNVGGTEPLSIQQMVETIGGVVGKTPMMKFATDPSAEGKDVVGDISLLKIELGYTPPTDFRQGISATLKATDG